MHAMLLHAYRAKIDYELYCTIVLQGGTGAAGLHPAHGGHPTQIQVTVFLNLMIDFTFCLLGIFL